MDGSSSPDGCPSRVRYLNHSIFRDSYSPGNTYIAAVTYAPYVLGAAMNLQDARDALAT